MKPRSSVSVFQGSQEFIRNSCGTSIGAISDDKGFFSIPNVPPGTYDVRVTFVGYSDSQASVQVSAGEVTMSAMMILETH